MTSSERFPPPPKYYTSYEGSDESKWAPPPPPPEGKKFIAFGIEENVQYIPPSEREEENIGDILKEHSDLKDKQALHLLNDEMLAVFKTIIYHLSTQPEQAIEAMGRLWNLIEAFQYRLNAFRESEAKQEMIRIAEQQQQRLRERLERIEAQVKQCKQCMEWED